VARINNNSIIYYYKLTKGLLRERNLYGI